MFLKLLPKPKSRRLHERIALNLPGQLYLPAEQTAQRCTVTNISAGGARIVCTEPPPANAFVILQVEGFGRFEAVTANYSNPALGLRFLVAENRVARLSRQIVAFVRGGAACAAQAGIQGVN